LIPQPETHLNTPDEIKQVRDLAFKINLDDKSCADFINQHFKNLNLLKWAAEINEILNKVSTPPRFKIIHFKDDPNPEMIFQFYDHLAEDDTEGLAFSRKVYWKNEELLVSHDFFRIPKKDRGKGISKAILFSSLKQYINMGVNTILVHAALTDGGYAWARHFFTATNRLEMRNILSFARRKLSANEFGAVQRIYTNYYTNNPTGKAFPIYKWSEFEFMKSILRGSEWHGSLNLKNQEQMLNFISYVDQ